jgi:hypothetical protein
MRTPEVVSITVVEHDGKKKFFEPGRKPSKFDSLDLRLGVIAEVNEGMVSRQLYVGKFGSWLPHDPPSPLFEKEIDTPCILFRKGEYFDSGCLSYFGGSDGYHLLEGFKRINNPMDTGGSPRVYMDADWFEVDDVIAFVRMSRSKEVVRR